MSTKHVHLSRKRISADKVFENSGDISMGQKAMKLKGSLPSLLLLIVVVVYLLGYIRFRTSSGKETPPQYAGLYSHSEEVQISSDFFQAWISENEARLDWQGYLQVCKEYSIWQPTKQWWLLKNRTDPESSYISLWDIKPAGQYSRFFIQSQLPGGKRKHIGGDSWRVHINGPASLNPTINDFGNGTYEVKFLAMEGGKYEALIFLDYTLCGGIVDPPKDWFINGNTQGKEQYQGILGNDIPYMKRPLWNGEPVSIIIKEPTLPTEKERLKSACNIKTPPCDFIWNGLGRWVKEEWKPFCNEIKRVRKGNHRKGILWFYGDSTSLSFYSQVRSQPLCTKIFRICLHSYNWIYQIENYNSTLRRFVRQNATLEKRRYDNLDWSVKRTIDELKQVLAHPHMDENSVLLLNYGLHFVEVLNFSNYRRLIDTVVELAKDSYGHKCQIIWRSTTAINRHKYSKPDLHSRRFLTQQRVELFNAYANKAMCAAGIPVLDFFPLTNAFPAGTGSNVSPHDPVHYLPVAMRPIVQLLVDLFRKK